MPTHLLRSLPRSRRRQLLLRRLRRRSLSTIQRRYQAAYRSWLAIIDSVPSPFHDGNSDAQTASSKRKRSPSDDDEDEDADAQDSLSKRRQQQQKHQMLRPVTKAQWLARYTQTWHVVLEWQAVKKREEEEKVKMGVGKSKRKKRHENGLRKLKGVSVRRLGDWERSGNVLWASEIVENMARKLQGMGLREVNTVLDMIGVKRVSSVDIGKVKAMDEGFGLCFVKRNVEESIHEEGEEE